MLTKEEFNHYLNLLINYRKASDKIYDFFGIGLFDGKLGNIVDDIARLIIKSLNLENKEVEDAFFEDLLNIVFENYFEIPSPNSFDDPELENETIRIDKNNLYDYFINPKVLA